MSEVKFQQLSVRVSKDAAAEVEAFFLESGAVGYYELLYAEGVTDNLNEDDTTLFFFYTIDFPLAAFAPMALAVLGLEESPYEVSPIDYEDYIRRFEETFRSFPLTEHTWLIPPWDAENPEIPSNVRRIALKPGMAFGTGMHATSQLMVGFIEQGIQPGDRVIDMGTGSGILAIAAGLMGAAKIQGVDVEKLAVESAQENFNLNAYPQALEADFFVGDFGFWNEKVRMSDYNVFVANILARIFYANREELRSFLLNSERWALSGVIDELHEEFSQFLEEMGAAPFLTSEKDGWRIYYRI